MGRPVLFCYDGSEGSKAALSVAVELVMHPADAVVLAVWTPVTVQLARAGSLLTAVPMKASSTRRRSPRDIDARQIVCGQRGRGAFASAVLGSVSPQLSAHAERPVLIAPQHRGA
ncbi:MAG: universal stress protein [Solirubrobacteraceae bacterium]